MSYIGRFCLVQSPDGAKCGLVKSLALSSHVTSGSPEKAVVDVLKQLHVICLEDAPLGSLRNMSKVFLNGQWIAVHEHRNLAESMRFMRRTSNLHFEVSVTFVRLVATISYESRKVIHFLSNGSQLTGF